jgi:hypothetical protein
MRVKAVLAVVDHVQHDGAMNVACYELHQDLSWPWRGMNAATQLAPDTVWVTRTQAPSTSAGVRGALLEILPNEGAVAAERKDAVVYWRDRTR